MTENQTKLAGLQIEQSEKRERANALLSKDDRTGDESTELDTVTKRLQALEPELRAALTLVQSEDDKSTQTDGTDGLDAETRERLDLRSKCAVTRFVQAAIRGRAVDGPEAEFMAACGVDGIPLELFEPDPREQREEQRAITGTPSTVGTNLDPIRPAVFAASIAPRIGIEMPRVMSGTFATATISTSLSAGHKAKNADIAATAAAFTVSTAMPRRLSARLEISIEDIAAVGQANFEAMLRDNLMLVMSDQLDDSVINGNRPDSPSGDETGLIEGFLSRITAPTAPTTLATFDDFAAAHAGGVDGLWSENLKQVGLVVGADTYQLSAKLFQSATNYKGELSAAAYAMANTGGYFTNSRMPAAAATIQQAILYRMGRPGLRRAVCPHWGSLSIDDIFSGSAAGRRALSMHVLVGDVILTQPNAYARTSFKVST